MREVTATAKGEVFMSITQHDSERSDTNQETPLLSEEGKDFLAGRIDAEEYIRDGRRRVEDLAVRQVDEHVHYRSSRNFRTLLFAFGFIAYGFLAGQSLIKGQDTTTAVLAGTTAIVMGVISGVMFARLWRGRSHLPSNRVVHRRMKSN
jgi:hypothetical protein